MIFTKKCFCTKQAIDFEAEPEFEFCIDAVFCPDCADRAPEEAFLVEVTAPAEKAGIYALNPNQSVFAEADDQFEDAGFYYERMWGLRKLAIADTEARFAGMNRELEGDLSSLSGPDRVFVREEEPTQLPKKIKAGPRERGKKKNN